LSLRGLRECTVLAIAAIALYGCGNTTGPESPPSQAATSDIVITGSQPGSSPFISIVKLSGNSVWNLAGVEFIIAPKPASVSKPVDVRYTLAALYGRGYVSLSSDVMSLPVFGLYAGYANQVSLRLQFQDGSAQTLPVAISTAPYVDPTGIYGNPNVLVKRPAGSQLGFDFFVLKSTSPASPVVVDTDAEIRWVAPGLGDAMSSIFQNDEFIVGDETTPTLYRLRLDGTLTQSTLASPTYTMFHHNIDPGKIGLFAEVNAVSGGVVNYQTTVAEITEFGAVLNHWDLAAILSAYMLSQGDDPTAFIRPGVDWFHSNSSTYDPSDDSVIVSSRENFVIKVDYQSGNIIWILGDPTKFWYTFPSLRAKALTLAAGGLYPIGQHALSITSDGLLMLFNDGFGSLNQPAGAPAGSSRTYSAVSAYSIDKTSMTAHEVWRFDYGQSIYSIICSSAYESPEQSILVDFAAADHITQARLVGLDSGHNVVFDFEYPTISCNTAWNAEPIAFDDLTIT
jgi:arylsulfate sulfotransferase